MYSPLRKATLLDGCLIFLKFFPLLVLYSPTYIGKWKQNFSTFNNLCEILFCHFFIVLLYCKIRFKLFFEEAKTSCEIFPKALAQNTDSHYCIPGTWRKRKHIYICIWKRRIFLRLVYLWRICDFNSYNCCQCCKSRWKFFFENGKVSLNYGSYICKRPRAWFWQYSDAYGIA